MVAPVVAQANSPEMMSALSVFGKMLSIASIYGMNHPSVAGPLKDAYQALSDALNQDGRVLLGLFHKTLTVNDKMVSEYTVHLRALERRFIALNVPHLAFCSGMSLDELRQLVDALCQSGGAAGKSIMDQLADANLDHIRADHVEYVAQHEGERLVGEDEEDSEASEGTGGETAGQDEGKGDGKEEAEEPPPSIQIEQIMAFLKGGPSEQDPPSDDLKNMLSDPEKLGQLIMESVSIRQSVQSLDNSESLADIVIGCLRRTYDGLSEQKKYKSAAGKASLHKAMLLLEKTVVDKIRNATGEEQPEVDEQILEALREAEEQRQVEILAARYAEQHKKITKAEMDILKYVRKHGEDKARVLLESSPVPEQEWNRLMVQSRTGPADGSAEGGDPGADGDEGGGGEGRGDNIDMGALAIVLDKLETIMDLDNMPPELIKSAVEEVRENVEEATQQVETQIGKLEAQVEQHETEKTLPPDQRKSKKSRADLLLEISQLALKLSQPLTVITVSIDALLQDSTPPDLHKDMLELAKESGACMKKLMKRLTALVGYPSMKEADQNLLLHR